MSSKYLNRFTFIYFLNCLQCITSRPLEMMENKLNRTCGTCDTLWLNFPVNISDVEGIHSSVPADLDSVEMENFLQPAEESTPPQVTEGSNSLSTESDFNVYHNNSICFDNFDIMPQTDGRSGTRTVAEMPAIGDNLVTVRCFWPIHVAKDSTIEISIQIQQSDWDLSCTTWNLTVEQEFDLENPQPNMTVVCPRERKRIVKIPRETKRAVAILAGLMSRAPRLSLNWTYLNVSKLSENDLSTREKDWSENTSDQTGIIVVSFSVFTLGACCVCYFELRKPRRTHDEQDFQVTFVPRSPSTTARLQTEDGQQEQLPLLPQPDPSFSTFELKIPPLERLF